MIDKESEIKSVQIIKIEGSKFIFNDELFQTIIDQNKKCHNLPVAVIIINGALRTGKSFFNNFVIRYLRQLENPTIFENNNEISSENYDLNTEIVSRFSINNNNDNNDNNDNDDVDDNMLKDYFASRRGANIQTLGVWALNKIFIYEKKAIFLMDTQGIFDQELNQAMTIALISLSTILSSYQIYNLDKRIQEDHLCNVAYFSAYSSLISNTSNTKIGQTLCLLVRDWQNYENNFDIERCNIETENYKNDFFYDTDSMDNIKLETRKKIFDAYDNVVVRLCPHPGYIVTEGKFSGKMAEIREDFQIHIKHIINDMLKNIEPKRISNTQTLLCRELPVYMREYINLYENVKDNLPAAMTILETTEKICQDNAKTKTVHYYKEKMMTRLKSKALYKDDIVAWHNSCLRDSHKYFNRIFITGCY